VWWYLESEIGPHNVEDLNSRGQHEEATKVYFLESYIGTLHKAFIEFANIFMSVLLHELDQRPSHGSTVLTLCTSPVAHSLNQNTLQKAYCLYIYRNKIVVHHDVPRTFATKHDRGDGRRWLKPLVHMTASSSGITDADWRDVAVLHRRYRGLLSDPTMVEETNPYEMVDALFYIVPGPRGEQVSKDRALINKIAERVGCQSMTVHEVLTMIDDFTRAMLQAAPAWVRLP